MPLEFVPGGIAFDDRGSVSFINEFKVLDYKRFYVVQNHKQGFIRAWHGHKHESKAVVLLQGSALVCAVEVDDWEAPSPNLEISRHVLSASKPGALLIPAGYANGFMNLTSDAILCFYSSSTVEESMNDDIRFDSRLWDPWTIEEK
jgi:dTDP-4-dehydrorhamnose 3,5-epimerase-like enzyme